MELVGGSEYITPLSDAERKAVNRNVYCHHCHRLRLAQLLGRTALDLIAFRCRCCAGSILIDWARGEGAA